MLVDAETLSQRPASSEVIPRVAAERGLVKHELFESIVELNSGVCSSPDEALDVVRELRRATAEAAGEIGCTIAAAGSHPTDIASEQEIADEPHYRGFVEYAGPTARRQGVQGLHVHVGMPDAETCLRVIEHFVPWLPVILALSANSPWFEGERTGLLSTRAEILGLLPRHGAPPRFESWADWERLVRRFVDSGRRRHVRRDPLGHPAASEVRHARGAHARPADGRRAHGRVRRARARARRVGARAASRARAAGDRAVFEQNRWAASRFGPRAELIHPERDGEARTARRSLPRARRAHRRRSARRDVCEADPQLAFDDPHEATADIVRRSLAVDAVTTETLQVTGIRCERCVMRLGKALEGHDGLESANANLMGQVMLSYDEERTSLDALLEKMYRAGFRPVQSPS